VLEPAYGSLDGADVDPSRRQPQARAATANMTFLVITEDGQRQTSQVTLMALFQRS